MVEEEGHGIWEEYIHKYIGQCQCLLSSVFCLLPLLPVALKSKKIKAAALQELDVVCAIHVIDKKEPGGIIHD